MSTGLYDTRIQGLKEQKATARKLREQAASETPQGQMVSGWYVAPSWTQNMANALRQGFAAYDEGKASREADRLEKQKEAETNAVMGQLYSNYQAPQAQPEQGFFDRLVNGEQQAPQQAPADLQANPNLDQNQRMAAMLRGSMVNPEVFAPMLDMEQHRLTMAQQKELKQEELANRKAQLEQQADYQQQNLDMRREQMQNQRDMQQQMLDLRRESMANRAAGGGGNHWEMIKDPTTGMPAGRYNTATGQFEAAQGMPQGQAPAPKLTEDQGKAMGWLTQATNAYNNMQNAMVAKDAAGNPIIDAKTGQPKRADVNPSFLEAIAPGEAALNLVRSPARQQYMQGAESMSEAILRAATGAGVTKDEALQKAKELTPRLGDTEALIKQKEAAIPLYLESLKTRAGAGAPLAQRALQQQGIPTQFGQQQAAPSNQNDELEALRRKHGVR